MTNDTLDLSIILPVYNEEESIPLLLKELIPVLDGLGKSFEVICVDDGSRDNSFAELKKLRQADDRVRVVRFRRNFGQTAAFAAGFDRARGDVVITMDADLQNDPADIPMMLEKLDEGYDVVSGWRVNRQDTYLTRTLPSNLANGLISRVTGVELHDYGCTLKAYRREVLTGFKLYGEMHRFIPVFAHSVGAKIIEVPVNHHARQFGVAKYGLERTFKVLLDLFTVKFLLSYSWKPIYLFGGTGIGIITLSAILLVYLFIRRVFFQISVFGSPLFQLSAMFFILGFQSILMGLIAELQVRTYHESQHKPTYTLRETINIEE